MFSCMYKFVLAKDNSNSVLLFFCFLFFLTKFFFPFKNVYNNTKKTFKINNKNNNDINQLLKLPLLKHSHTPHKEK